MFTKQKDGLPELDDFLQSKYACLRIVKNLPDPNHPQFIRKNISKAFRNISTGMKTLVKKS
jgi:hypothetical protein